MARQLLNELHHDLSEKPAAPPKVRPIVWKIALASLLFGVSVPGAILLLRSELPTQAAPARVVSAYSHDHCALRQASIMDAIDAYREKVGHVPLNLTELVPGFLPEVPLDTDSGQPYVYRGQGQNAAIACPDHTAHAAPRS